MHTDYNICWYSMECSNLKVVLLKLQWRVEKNMIMVLYGTHTIRFQVNILHLSNSHQDASHVLFRTWQCTQLYVCEFFETKTKCFWINLTIPLKIWSIYLFSVPKSLLIPWKNIILKKTNKSVFLVNVFVHPNVWLVWILSKCTNIMKMTSTFELIVINTKHTSCVLVYFADSRRIYSKWNWNRSSQSTVHVLVWLFAWMMLVVVHCFGSMAENCQHQCKSVVVDRKKTHRRVVHTIRPMEGKYQTYKDSQAKSLTLTHTQLMSMFCPYNTYYTLKQASK